jgi:hypothetical protein
MPAVAATSVIRYTHDGLAKSGYTVLSFTNKQSDRAISGVIARKALPESISINLRATDLTKTQLAAIFKILGAPPPPL